MFNFIDVPLNNFSFQSQLLVRKVSTKPQITLSSPFIKPHNFCKYIKAFFTSSHLFWRQGITV